MAQPYIVSQESQSNIVVESRTGINKIVRIVFENNIAF